MNVFLTIIGLLPSILQSVVAVENAFGKTVPGPVKKQIILSPTLTAAKNAGHPVPPHIAAAAAGLIDTVVNSLKSPGAPWALPLPAPGAVVVHAPTQPAAGK